MTTPWQVFEFQYIIIILLLLLQEAYRGCDSRMAQEVLRRHVLRVLRMWRSWSIFSDDFFNGLQVSHNEGLQSSSVRHCHPCSYFNCENNCSVIEA